MGIASTAVPSESRNQIVMALRNVACVASPRDNCEKQLGTLQEKGWLGGRDSNPDNVIQSHVSYR